MSGRAIQHLEITRSDVGRAKEGRILMYQRTVCRQSWGPDSEQEGEGNHLAVNVLWEKNGFERLGVTMMEKADVESGRKWDKNCLYVECSRPLRMTSYPFCCMFSIVTGQKI